MRRLRNLTESIKNYKFNSLFVRNFIIIFLVVMIPLDVLTLFFYSRNTASMYDEITETNKDYSYTVRNITDTLMKETRALTINTALLDRVKGYAINPASDATTSTLIEYCNSYTTTHNHLDSIYIYSERFGTVLTDSRVEDFDKFKDKGWYDEYLAITKEKTTVVARAKNDYYPYLLTIIHPIFPTDADKMGAVIVNVNVQELTKYFKSLDMNALSSQRFYITDSDSRIVYSEEQDDLLKKADEADIPALIFKANKENKSSFKSGGSTYMLTNVKSQFFDWEYHCIVPMTSFKTRSQPITAYLIVLLLTSLVVGLFGAFYLSIRTFRPIENILELIDSPHYQSGSSASADTYENESAYILNHISKTLTTNEQLKEELDMRLMLLKHSQIVVLQSQINPHFLFNTLDTINWMAIDAFDGENDVSEALTVLGELFKLNIDTSNYLTDLDSELSYTKQYTKILELRHKDTFTIKWNIESELGNSKVPRLILQPLIENALYHGIKPTRRQGHIDLSVEKEDKNIIIRIIDDGLGLDPEKLSTLSSELKEDYMFGGSHVGLKNINQRIKLIYGNEYGVNLESGNSGTVVTIIIPIT